jgi:hypothetical protein
MAHKIVLRGADALNVRAHDEHEVVTNVAGTAQVQNLVVNNVIVKGEAYMHDPIVDRRCVPEDSRWLISTEETGTLYIAPQRSDFVLPSPPENNEPLAFEFVGGATEGFKLISPCPVAPSSLFFVDCGMYAFDDSNELTIIGAKGFRVTVRSCMRHESDGTDTYMYRVTGRCKQRAEAGRGTCKADDAIPCDCFAQKAKEEAGDEAKSGH